MKNGKAGAKRRNDRGPAADLDFVTRALLIFSSLQNHNGPLDDSKEIAAKGKGNAPVDAVRSLK